ncbi:hypothetical protein E2C01_054968 [Portunus trituberculatus]|uniref:Uncharacterized protein n=1 Tax=Portunus trituberculatus TaxID=210409 RepID=A0A5B7GTC8_PORTR|nr:hypothetical protein [Portunus trituberculatus]
MMVDGRKDSVKPFAGLVRAAFLAIRGGWFEPGGEATHTTVCDSWKTTPSCDGLLVVDPSHVARRQEDKPRE